MSSRNGVSSFHNVIVCRPANEQKDILGDQGGPEDDDNDLAESRCRLHPLSDLELLVFGS